MEEVTKQVYEALKAGTETIRGLMADRAKVTKRINSGRYSEETASRELWPKVYDINHQIEATRAEAMRQARSHVADYRKTVEASNNLDGAKLTADAQLLAPGIAGTLTKDDYMSMLDRAKDNQTMTKLIMRTAEANNVKLGVVFVGGREEMEYASALSNVVGRYEKWMAEPNGLEMLNRFLPGYNENEEV